MTVRRHGPTWNTPVAAKGANILIATAEISYDAPAELEWFINQS